MLAEAKGFRNGPSRPAGMEHFEGPTAHIPKLGLGTWQNTGRQCQRTVEDALDLGYRHIDTAQAYDNEEAVGAGIAASTVPRDEIFLTTKLWRSNLRPPAVKSSVRASLDRLGVDAVDLLLIHWPHPRVPVAETLTAMADLKTDGLVKHLGVSNFTASQLTDAIRIADEPIVTNQVLYHPYKDQSRLLEVCRANDVALTAYSPLARGAVLDDDVLTRIGQHYTKSPAQVTLRWLHQQTGVIAIPKASSRDHLADNIAIDDFRLTEDEMTAINHRPPGLGMRLRNRLPGLMRRIPF